MSGAFFGEPAAQPVPVAILGSGNIGTDLMYKLAKRPDRFRVTMVAGVDPASEGLALAQQEGYQTATSGLDGILAADERPELVFDATTAHAHLAHAEVLRQEGIRAVDLTPAGVGPMVVPTVNLHDHLDAPNVNMVSCVGQATIPIVAALRRAVPHLAYVETVSTIASRSAGPGTRQNIDEFTHKTRRALEQVGGAARGKAISILNPAEPPVVMRNTIYAVVDGEADPDRVSAAIAEAAQAVKEYVPGYRLRGPSFEGNRVAVFTEVEGAGDYLPRYAGNLDIMTAAAVAVATAMYERSPEAA